MSTEALTAADPQTFRDTMASMAATACVVTACDGDRRLGRTVTAVLSLGIAPPAVLVSIAATSDLAAAIRGSGGFSLALLADGQHAVADAFAGGLDPADRFAIGPWDSWPSGRPRLTGAVGTMDCTVTNAMELADHILFAGTVTEIRRDPGALPLVWHGRRYKTVQPLPRPFQR